MPVKLFALGLLALLPVELAWCGEATRYEVVPSQSQVRFSVKKWSVLDVEGFFRRYRGEFRFDPDNPRNCSVRLEVETASITTGDEKRDEGMVDPQFFDSVRVPLMRFSSTEVTRAEGSPDLLVTGKLKIKDVERPIQVRVRLLGQQEIPGEGHFATFATEFTIDRRDYNVLGGSLSRTMIGNEIAIRLTLGGRRSEP